MNKRTDEIVVILSHLSWDFPCDHIRQTSLELAKKARVIIFSSLDFPTLRNLLFDRNKRKEWLSSFGEKRIIYFPSLAILPFRRFKVIEKLNIWLNLTLFRLFYFFKFGLKKPIFWAFSYQLAELKDYFGWGKLLVYDRVDQITSLDPKDNKKMKRADQELLGVADYVFTNSPYALKYIKRYNKQSFLVPCGCAVELFLKKKTKLPKEIRKIKKPILGFVGSVDHRLDYRLLFSLAKKRKNWSFVFIGDAFTDDLAQFKIVNLSHWLGKLKKLPNVYFLGKKPKEKMPDFISSFDVCLIPYKTTLEFVKGCNPMKLYEYLAMGKPVVSIPIEAVKQYSSTVKIANDARNFEKATEKLSEEGYDEKEEEKRKKIAKENSWKEKVKKMWEVISSG